MFKKTMFVVGVLVAATMSMPGAASAMPHRFAHFQRVHAARAAYRPRVFRSSVSRRGVYRPRVAVLRSVHRLHPYRERLATSYAPVRYGSRFGLWGRARAARGYAWRRPAFRSAVASSVVTSAPVASGVQMGRASFYGGGGLTAAGGRVGAATCAHRWLPFGTRVLVTNLANAHQAVLTVNDRGPFVGGRVIDVSKGAAGVLGMLHSGTAPVRVQVVGGPG